MSIDLIFGPPGTGKTTRLLDILDMELKTVDPTRIAYFSFTKEGTYQGVRRAKEKFGISDEQCQYFRTLHSLAFRMTGCSVTSIMAKKDYREFSKGVGMNFTGYYTEELRNNDDAYLFFDELYRNNPKTASLYLDSLNMPKLKYVRQSYRNFETQNGKVDFTDMISQYVKQATPLDIDVAFIDEAQDLTTLQWKMVWTAVGRAKRVYIAGDDDQAIFQWSGADVDAFLGIAGKVTILDKSHRLPDSILAFANTVSSQITKRVKKDYRGRGVKGVVRYARDMDDLNLASDGSIMFLSRNTCFLDPVVAELRKAGLTYRFKGENSLKKPEMEAITQYEEHRKYPAPIGRYTRLGAALKDTYDLDKPWYEALNWDQDKIAYYRNVIGAGNHTKPCTIDVSTIHSVKGAEADTVVLLSDMTRNTFANLKRNPDSEHRAFYVGVTRAKSNLVILNPQTNLYYTFYGKEST